MLQYGNNSDVVFEDTPAICLPFIHNSVIGTGIFLPGNREGAFSISVIKENSVLFQSVADTDDYTIKEYDHRHPFWHMFCEMYRVTTIPEEYKRNRSKGEFYVYA